MPGHPVVVEVVTRAGRAAGVEFRLHGGDVEIWHHAERVAAFDRGRLWAWLQEPGASIGLDGAVLSLDRTVDRGGRIAITLPDVTAWTLSPADHERLHSYLGES